MTTRWGHGPRALTAVLLLLSGAWGVVGCPGSGVGDAGSAPADGGAAPDGGDVDAGDLDGGASDGGSPAVVRTDVALTAADGTALTGFLTGLSSTEVGAPGVLLLHQYQGSAEQWSELAPALAERGWWVLALNLRGHGTSDPYDGPGLLTDPDGAPLDVEAGLAFLRDEAGAAPGRLAVVGTSVGANLAVAAAIQERARTYVAVSARLPPSEALADAPATGMASVLYLASEDDPGGQAADAQTLYEATADPRGIHIWPGSAHGRDLLASEPEAVGELVGWLDEHLP